MSFLAHALDDPLAEDCGKCANCDPASKIAIELPRELTLQAADYLKYRYVKIRPRKLFGSSGALAREAFPIYTQRISSCT